MNVAKSVRHCLRQLGQQAQTRVGQNLQALAVRHYHADDNDSFSWPPLRGAEEAAEDQYKATRQQARGKGGMRDPDSNRRHVTQAIEDHRRRQEQIILDNKRRWEQRSVPKVSVVHSHDVYGQGHGKGKPRRAKEDTREAEKYSRRRRQQRQKEVRRNERELRESRKGYKLPKSELHELEEATEEAPTSSRASNPAWLEQQRREDEQKYWHSWQSCPNQRRHNIIAPNDPEADQEHGTGRTPRPDGKQPKLPHGGSVRRFQTDSQQLAQRLTHPPLAPPQGVQTTKLLPKLKRRPSSMEKQFLLTHNKDNLRQPISLDNAPKHKLPQPIYRRLERHRAPKSVQPPRYQLSLKTKRQRTPSESFSNMLAVSTRPTPRSEYTGYVRQTISDAWRCFIATHSARREAQKHA